VPEALLDAGSAGREERAYVILVGFCFEYMNIISSGRSKKRPYIFLKTQGDSSGSTHIHWVRSLIVVPRPMPVAPRRYFIVVPRSLPAAPFLVRFALILLSWPSPQRRLLTRHTQGRPLESLVFELIQGPSEIGDI
jgi:hypothetical protein